MFLLQGGPLLTHGGKLPEIANMLTESTGRTFEHQDVYNLVKKLQKRFLVNDGRATGIENVEIRDMGTLLGYGREWRRERLES